MFNGMTDPFVYKMAKQINNEKVESEKTSVGKLSLKFIKEKIKEKVKKEGIVKFGVDEEFSPSAMTIDEEEGFIHY